MRPIAASNIQWPPSVTKTWPSFPLRSVIGPETPQALKAASISICVAFSPDGRRIVSGSDDRTVRLWATDDGTELQTFRGHTSAVMSVAFAPDDKRLVSGGYEGTARVYHAESGIPSIGLRPYTVFGPGRDQGGNLSDVGRFQ